jgi:TfuA protein
LNFGGHMSSVAVYLGPTLDLVTARSLLDATYLPPIKRGDLQELPSTIKTVGIIDGVFHQSLAVSPKEVMALLDRGMQVYGAASIGALRAAEMHMYGMNGVGAIFEMYRDREIDADDEVAVAYDPSTDRALSEPLVNMRLALRIAVKEGVISADEAGNIICELKQIYFPLRSYQVVKTMCPALTPFLNARAGCLDQKRDDAVLLLRTIAGPELTGRTNGSRRSSAL